MELRIKDSEESKARPRTYPYLIVIGISVVCGASISLLISSETITEKIIDEPVDRSDPGLGGV
jgi:hypothetical protein